MLDDSDVFYCPTDDGWLLAVHRYPPQALRQRHYPVLMVHGMGANGGHFDFSAERSFARSMQQQGFDVYVVELRGAGLSQPPPHATDWLMPWSFVDYAKRDLPAVVQALLERLQIPCLHGMGHSMGGMLLYSLGVSHPSVFCSITTLGSPLLRQLHWGPREQRLLNFVSNMTPAAALPQVGQQRLPLRRLLKAAGRFVSLSSRLADDILFNAANCELEDIARLVRSGIEDIPLQLVTEIIDLTQQAQTELSPKQSDENSAYLYETQLDKITAPTLAVAGAADRIALPNSVYAAVMNLVSAQVVRYRVMGVQYGDHADYGHLDLLMGRRVVAEVYTQVIDFIIEMDVKRSG